MGTIYFDRTSSSDWVKYKDGYWIGHRKRVYLYWFKYLQHAELSSEYNVDWTKYDGWGGSNSVLGMKFDNWWMTTGSSCSEPKTEMRHQDFPSLQSQ